VAGVLAASAQQPTPRASSPPDTTDEGFFDGFGIAEALDAITVIGVAILGFWLFKVQGEKVALLQQQAQAARDELTDQRNRSSDEIDGERRHTTLLIENHKATVEHLQTAKALLEDRVEDAKRQVGIDPAGQVSAQTVELPVGVRGEISEILSLLKEMRATPEEFEEQEVPAPSPEAIAKEHLDHGNAYFAAGDYERALEEYSRALEMQPEDRVLVANRGVALLRLGRHDEALQGLNRSLQLRPDDPDTLMNKGIVLRNLGHYDEALQAYDRALKLRPDHPDTLNNKGVALAHLHRLEEALANYDGALLTLPEDPWVRSNRGVTLGLLGRDQEAIADFDRALEISPPDGGVYYDRACYFALKGKAELSQDDLKRAVDADPRCRPMARRDSFFDNLRNDPEYGPRFRELVGEGEPPEASPPS
jgi:tetratricopeptide (TPR) repeat protein